MGFKLEEEDYLKSLCFENEKNKQIKTLEINMWNEIKTLKESTDNNKYTKITEIKQKYYKDIMEL